MVVDDEEAASDGLDGKQLAHEEVMERESGCQKWKSSRKTRNGQRQSRTMRQTQCKAADRDSWISDRKSSASSVRRRKHDLSSWGISPAYSPIEASAWVCG